MFENDEAEMLQKYRRREDGIETDEEDQDVDVVKTSRSEKTESVSETLGRSSGLRSKRGRDADDGEVEDKVDSDQEEDQQALLEKMRYLKSKMRKIR